jgi:hypothetical protein
MSDESLASFDQLARYTEGRTFDLAGLDPVARTGAGAGGSLAAAVSAATRAYSVAVGIDFDSAATTPLASAPLDAPPVAESGLVGRHVRWVRDPAGWTDLWAAHVSLMPEDGRPAAPPVDFGQHHVVVLGGRGQGLALEAIETDGDRRWARVRPVADEQVRFALVRVTSEEP